MDNVQKTNNCINMPSSQTFKAEVNYSRPRCCPHINNHDDNSRIIVNANTNEILMELHIS
jgi:hypothetical protein